ncbi:hypothetical protein ACA910_012877 [Epithemia clementina (nom. ined.)]
MRVKSLFITVPSMLERSAIPAVPPICNTAHGCTSERRETRNQLQLSGDFITSPLSSSSSNLEKLSTPVLLGNHTNDDSRKVEMRPNMHGRIRDAFKWTSSRPPIQVDDSDLLLYDIFLLVNLSLSISFWVVHRMQIGYIGLAFNEGCLLALCWVGAGLWNGVFLHSAVDGHYRSSDDRAGPKAACLLALSTFVGSINLRLLFALIVAAAEHRPIGAIGGEQLMPLELGFGMMLMTSWRALHSFLTPRA